jgi:hypothetical protein
LKNKDKNKIQKFWLVARLKINSYLHATCHIQKRCKQAEKPAAQTAHLVFAGTRANAEKTKRAVFCLCAQEKP